MKAPALCICGHRSAQHGPEPHGCCFCECSQYAPNPAPPTQAEPVNVYIEQEGRQFGLENRVRLVKEVGGKASIPHRIDAPFFMFPVLRMRLWRCDTTTAGCRCTDG